MTRLTRAVKPNRLGCTGRNGRTWDRSKRSPDQLSVTWADFERLLQGILVDGEGRPIALSTTGFHSALGRIRDMVGGSEGLRRVARRLLEELSEQ
jgi:hypothetical protein